MSEDVPDVDILERVMRQTTPLVVVMRRLVKVVGVAGGCGSHKVVVW